MLGTLILIAVLVVSVPPLRPGGPGLSPVGVSAARVVPAGASPPPTTYGSMAYDVSTSTVVLFGGKNLSNAAVGTTWEFRADNWTNVSGPVGSAPAARWGAAVTYDPSIGGLLLFGGCGNPQCHPAFDDTWEFVNAHWTELTSQLVTSPSPRGYAAMTYDATDGAALLFGGFPENGSSYPDNDTWEFSNNSWHSVPTSGSAPAARYDDLLQYDPDSRTTVLFGGVGATADLGDTWDFRAGNWTKVATPLSTPTARHGAASCFDAADGYVFVLGGEYDGNALGDAWAFNGTTWSALTVTGDPPPGYGSQMAYDAADGYVLWFSGQPDSSHLYLSTASYAHGSWTLLLTPGTAGPSLLIEIVPFLLPLLLIFGMVTAVTASQGRKGRREAAEGFPLPSGSAVTWVETGEKSPPGTYATVVLPATMTIVFVPAIVIVAADGSSAAALLAVLFLIVIPIVVVTLAISLWQARSRMIRSIAVVPAGVVVRRPSYDLRLYWDYLRPAEIFQNGKPGWFNFRYGTPKQPSPERWLVLNSVQTRAILSSAHAPRWPIPALQARLLGVASN
ncbi:MAG TPA: kelch repeat-containing protein, partial [Thermoplasmata archaeon]|nr:kelch repeat-containing protein [Thermoplasmata archaeon]